MHRRSYLAGLSLGTLLLAGCAGAPTDPDDDTADQAATEYPVRQLGDSFTEPQWATARQPTESAGVVARFERRDELRWLVDRESTPEEVTSFVDETDFSSATLLYLQSVGPTGCYRELAVDDVAVDDDAITATASAVDTSEEGALCTQAVTYPSAFVRVTGDDLPPATRVTLTNGWGTTAEIDATAPLIDPDTLAGGVQPDGDPPAVPAAIDCATEAFDRHAAYVDDDSIEYGTLTDDSGQPTFALRVRNPGDAADNLTMATHQRYRPPSTVRPRRSTATLRTSTIVWRTARSPTTAGTRCSRFVLAILTLTLSTTSHLRAVTRSTFGFSMCRMHP